LVLGEGGQIKPISDPVEAIMEEIGQDAQAIETRKAFVGLGENDLPPVRRLHLVLHALGPEFSRRFYDHLLSFPEMRRLIPDTEVLERLQQSQTRYFDGLTAGECGTDYIRGSLRVGVVHQRIGLDRTWYLGAYAKYLVNLIPEISQRLDDEAERIATIQVLIKIVFFDMGLAIETYAHADRKHILALRRYGELVFSAMPLALAVLRDDLTVVAINPAFARLFGLHEAQAHGRSLAVLIRAEALEAKLQDVLVSGTTLQDVSCEVAPAAGAPALAVKVTATRFLSPEGEPRLLLILQDTTEQDRLHPALKKSEAALLRAQEVARIGNWEPDLTQNRLTWSPEVYRIFGLPRETPLSYETFLSCVHPDDRERVDAARRAALEGTAYHIEHRIVVGEEIRWVEERAELAFDREGRPLKAVGTVQDITDRKAAEARIEHLAFYDPLTGLPNRTLFMDRLQHELAAAERRGKPLALLFLDLDQFKEINDTLGHDAGDRVLVEVARRFRAALREEETLARLSCGEFVVIASDSGNAAVRIAERVAQALALPVSIGPQEFAVSASISIAVFPEDGRTSKALLKAADIAMYRAKTAGGGYRFYRSEMGEEFARGLHLAQHLERALRAGPLDLNYQPQIDLGNGRLIGAEALARWPDAEWGMVSPAEFIPIAEECALAAPLGEWALATACRQVRQWEATGCPGPFRLAVNVSAKQFEDDGFVETVIRTAHEHGVAPGCIELELTESAMAKDPQRAVEVVEALRAAGFALSIDDFGTGYSSLS
jgi:diguanylate cyclase (GGDEF)-like protein/PAS domain S-box-containing protein